jgi:hypothetical protein
MLASWQSVGTSRRVGFESKPAIGRLILCLVFALGAMCASSGTAPGLSRGGQNGGRNESERECKFCTHG